MKLVVAVRYIVAVVLMSLSAPMAMAQTGTPITITNGDFETGSFNPWGLRQAGELGTTYQVVGGGAGGSAYCGQMYINAGSSTSAKQATYIYQNFPTTLGWYRLTFWMKTQLTAGRAFVALYANNGIEVPPGAGTVPRVSGTTGWTQYSIAYEVKSASYPVFPQCQTESAQGYVWFDNVTLERTPNPVALANNGFEASPFNQNWGMRTAETSAYTASTDRTEGAYSGKITVTTANSSTLKQAAYYSHSLPVAAGYYRITYWMKTALNQGTATAAIYAQTPSGQLTWLPGIGGVPVAIGSTNWAQYSFVYQLPSGVTNAVLQLQAENTLQSTSLAGSQSVINYDNVIVEALSSTEGGAAVAQQTAPATPIAIACGAPSQPLKITNPFGGLLYTDPSNGHPMLAMNSSLSPTGSAVLTDYNIPSSAVSTNINFPAGGTGGEGIIFEAGSNLAFESTGTPLQVVQVNTATKTLATTTSSPDANSYVWQFVLGSDGYKYFGSYPTCHVYKYASSGTISDVGSMDVNYAGAANSPANFYVRSVGATINPGNSNLDGWIVGVILGSSGNTTAGIVASKGSFRKMVQGTQGVKATLTSVYDAVTGATNVFAGGWSNGRPLSQLVIDSAGNPDFIDATLAPVSFPVAPGGDTWDRMLVTSRAGSIILHGKVRDRFYLIQGGTAVPLINVATLKGGTLIGVDGNLNMVGFRGQSFFVVPHADWYPTMPTDLTSYLHPIFPAGSASQPPVSSPFFLRADPAGGVTGASSFGQFLFRYNPASPGSAYTSDIADNSNGEIYDGRWSGGKFYFATYPSGNIDVWDPSQPWNGYGGINPKIATSTGYLRPQGGLVLSPTTNKLYAGWVDDYFTQAGGLSEYNPATNALVTWPASQFDLNNQAVSMGTVATDGPYVYGVTSNQFNGTSATTKQPLTFFMFNPVTNTVLARLNLGIVESASAAVFYVPGTGRIWVAQPNGLRLFDTAAKTLGPVLPWPAQCKYNVKIPRFDTLGNSAWIVVGSTIVQLHDGVNPWLSTLFDAGSKGVNGIAANGVDNKLYVASGTDLYASAITP